MGELNGTKKRKQIKEITLASRVVQGRSACLQLAAPIIPTYVCYGHPLPLWSPHTSDLAVGPCSRSSHVCMAAVLFSAQRPTDRIRCSHGFRGLYTGRAATRVPIRSAG